MNAVARAMEEDIGLGDITSELTVPGDQQASGAFFARQRMVVAGIELLEVVYGLGGDGVKLEILKPSGSHVEPGECLARVEGHARTLLRCERTALNFVQRLSGVATLASRFVQAVAGTKCRVLDTRKTTPGLRILEKMAAAAGGVTNHRMGLFDAILIKNNHITAAGGVRAALEAVKGQPIPVEIEVRTMEELDEALGCGATRLLLDNLTPDEARQWIAHIAGRALVELSGGITLETVRAYAEAGADYVSSGSITHSARAVDINFRLTLA
ncbi:carboxylating nicotinate-nucleotide diphosphorylase [Paludibaculum fermentans]|uniref:Probable nicotinate-nucleotide pyrophosphorylase [carboxylating] n=2 Tax=Paludibaculum fermentans TaxID=1473598 RepID=A0A7S7NY35_PALFE|nr:carboxylating nicotinate-nucleotide diphosphorylase [Paludibaculum fermentans]